MKRNKNINDSIYMFNIWSQLNYLFYIERKGGYMYEKKTDGIVAVL